MKGIRSTTDKAIRILVVAAMLTIMLAGCVAPAATTSTGEAAAPMVDIELWANATVTEAGPPPDDWVAYERIRDELGINLKYVIVPPGGDGETVINAAAAGNNLPDLFQIVSSSGDSGDVGDTSIRPLITVRRFSTASITP